MLQHQYVCTHVTVLLDSEADACSYIRCLLYVHESQVATFICKCLQVHIRATSIFQASWNTRTQTKTFYWEYGSIPKAWCMYCMLSQFPSLFDLCYSHSVYLRTWLKYFCRFVWKLWGRNDVANVVNHTVYSTQLLWWSFVTHISIVVSIFPWPMTQGDSVAFAKHIVSTYGRVSRWVVFFLMPL